MDSRSLRKTFLGCKTGKSLWEDLHLKEAEEDWASFLQVFRNNCSKKKEVRSLLLEETCLKFSHTRRTLSLSCLPQGLAKKRKMTKEWKQNITNQRLKSPVFLFPVPVTFIGNT